MSDHDWRNTNTSSTVLLRQSAEALEREEAASTTQRDTVDRVACRLGDSSCATAHAVSISRSKDASEGCASRSLLRLQRQYGNRYVGRVIHRAASSGDNDGMADVERSIDNARGSGHGLDHGVRSQMESAFGANFGGVRIHADSGADELSRSLSARAFTTGNDIFFRQGEYSPGSSGGRELLAHELTHVVQQNGDGIRRKMTVSQPDDPQEAEADQMARAVMQGEHATAASRQFDEEKPELATKRDASSVQRQPEAPSAEEEERKKGLQAKHDASTLARQVEEEPPE